MADYQPLTDLLLFPFVVVALAGLGSPLRLLVIPGEFRRVEFVCLQYAFGLGLCAYLWFALSLLKLLYPAAAWIALVMGWAAFAARWAALAVGALGRRKENPVPASQSNAGDATRRRSGAYAVLAAALVLFQFLGALTPETGHDALAYHLYTPRVFIWNHGMVPMPYNYQSLMPLNAQMPFLWSLLLGGEVLAKLIYWSQLAAMAVLVASACNRAFGRPVGAFACFMLVVTFSAAYQHAPLSVGSDVPVGLFAAAALAVMMRGAREARWRTAIAAGAFCGFAAGAKYTSIPFVLFPLLGAYAAALLLSKEPAERGRLFSSRLRSAAVQCCALGGIAAALFAPWALRAWLETGDPVYFAFSRCFTVKPDYRAGAEIPAKWEEGFRPPVRFSESPWKWATSQMAKYGWGAKEGDLLLLVSPLCALLCLAIRDRRATFLAIATLLANLAFFTLTLGQAPRLFSIAMPMTASVFALALLRAPGAARVSRPVAAAAAIGALAMFAQKQSTFMTNPAHAWDGLPKLAHVSTMEYLRPKGHFSQDRLNLYHEIDERLPPSAKILFSNVHFVYHCPRQAIAAGEWNEDYLDTMLASQEARLASQEAMAKGSTGMEGLMARLAVEKFTHIVFNDSSTSTPAWRDRFGPRLRLVWRSGGFGLYEIVFPCKR